MKPPMQILPSLATAVLFCVHYWVVGRSLFIIGSTRQVALSSVIVMLVPSDNVTVGRISILSNIPVCQEQQQWQTSGQRSAMQTE